jgi:hypothetical protein
MSLLQDGRVAYRLRVPRKNGATHLVLEPIQLMARISSRIPPPRFALTRYAGVFASSSPWRADAVAYGRDASATKADAATKGRQEEVEEAQGRTQGPARAGTARAAHGRCRPSPLPPAPGFHGRSCSAGSTSKMSSPARAAGDGVGSRPSTTPP